MFFPVRDDNPHTQTPYVNYLIVAVCVAVFLWQFSLGEKLGEAAIYAFGLIPAKFSVVTVFTSMFMHGGWMHLIGNMWFLWIFGDNIEASVGHKRYLFFYLICGVAAALAQIMMDPGSDIPMIGASGAVSGILGAYLILHPRSNVKVFVLLIVFITFINLPAWIVLGVWFAGQLIGQAGANPGEPGVAFVAHIGGFVAGMALIAFFKKRGVHILEPAHSRPFAVQSRPTFRGRRGIPDYDPRDRRGPWG